MKAYVTLCSCGKVKSAAHEFWILRRMNATDPVHVLSVKEARTLGDCECP